MIKSAGLTNLTRMLGIDSLDRGARMEDAAVKRDLEQYGSLDGESPLDMNDEDGMRILSAGPVTINHAPPETQASSAPETQAAPETQVDPKIESMLQELLNKPQAEPMSLTKKALLAAALVASGAITSAALLPATEAIDKILEVSGSVSSAPLNPSPEETQ